MCQVSVLLSVRIIQSNPKTEIFVWQREEKYWSSSWRRPCVRMRRWPQADWQEDDRHQHGGGCTVAECVAVCLTEEVGAGRMAKTSISFPCYYSEAHGVFRGDGKLEDTFGKVELMLLHWVECSRFKWNIALTARINATSKNNWRCHDLFNMRVISTKQMHGKI